MNWVDLVIIFTLVFFAYEGLGKSLLYEIYNLLSFLAAFFLSLKFYNLSSKQLEILFPLPHSLANVLGFIGVWYATEIGLYILARFFLPKVPDLNLPGEKFLSIIPAFLRGVIFIAVLLVLLATFPIQPQIKKEIRSSKIGSAILTQTYQLEAPLKNVFGDLANDTLSFLTVKPATNETVNLGFQNNKFYFDEGTERAMIDLVNKERVKEGLQTLTYDPALRQIARAHSADMFKRGYFSHYSPEGLTVADRAVEVGIKYLIIGENLAYAPSLELAHQGLMNSPGHRANILSPDYKKIGIGVANGDEYGIMFTQVFKD